MSLLSTHFFSIYDWPQVQPCPGTNLVTLRISHLKHLNECQGLMIPSGQAGNFYEPIVFVANHGISGMVKVPNGCVALHSTFGKLADEPLKPGLHLLGPGHKITYLVTKHAFVFDTPVQDVLTADNVPVAIDCQLLCRINDARQFIISIGAEKFDQNLRASQDEALRQLARQTKAADVRDLQGIETTDILSSLADKFDDYGVEVMNMNITSVRLQPDLAATLQKRSATQTFKSLETREQEFQLLKISNRENLELQRGRLVNAEREARREAERRIAEAHREVVQDLAVQEKAIASVNAEADAEITEINGNAQLQIANIDAQTEEEIAHIIAQGDAEEADLNAQACALRQQAAASVTRIIEEAEAERVRLLGEAEQDFAASMTSLRRYELDLDRVSIMKDMVTTADLIRTTGMDFMTKDAHGNVVGQGQRPQIYFLNQN